MKYKYITFSEIFIKSFAEKYHYFTDFSQIITNKHLQ